MNRGVNVVLCFMVVLTTACGAQDASKYETVVPAEIQAGSDIPAPTGNVVLTLSGNISTTNAGDQLQLDLTTLEKFGLVQYEVPDPWLKEDVTYAGILLADLLELAGAPNSATIVTATALDGYAADIPLAEIEKWPVLLATQAGGEYLTIDSNGPTRIIFPYNRHNDVSAARNMSVWNIATLEVK